MIQTDYLIIGSGLAGLSLALKASEHGQVILLSKKSLQQTNTSWAQGGIASAISEKDSFESHYEDTILAGDGLCNPAVVKEFVSKGPECIQTLVNWGVNFDLTNEKWDLTKEGAHTNRRILHVKDHTGKSIHSTLLEKCLENKNIKILENHFAIDLLTTRKLNLNLIQPNECLGSYVFNQKDNEVISIIAKATILATGGAGKTYLYTSNWDGATGDGIAMAYRAGCRVGNLEFMQFHPTCLFHPISRNFLISEALRGEGGKLVNSNGSEFMKDIHPKAELAPRDIVARGIDSEMKKSGADCVFLKMSHLDKTFIVEHFPQIHKKCSSLGIDITKDPIPVVPAAHYLCGGVFSGRDGQTDIHRLFTIGETAFTGFHGANRLASNSLLECVAMSINCNQSIKSLDSISSYKIAQWKNSHQDNNEDEMIVISHMWDEIRRLMWNYVGIVRSNKRLNRAQTRIKNLREEIKNYYWDFPIHNDILELRNLALVADLTVQCALKRKESRGIHYNIDYPNYSETAENSILS